MIGKVFQVVVGFLLNLVRFHKLKIVAFLGAVLLFIFLLFPYSDLSDYVTTQISKATQQKVYVRFETMDLSFFPAPGLQMENVTVESMMFPKLTFDELKIRPSIASFLAFSPGVTILANGLWGGEVAVTTKGGKKTENGNSTQRINIETSEISLQSLAKVLKFPMPLSGKMNLSSQTTIEPTFAVQPEGDIEINLDQFQLVAANVPTPMGPINVPGVKISKVSLVGRLSDGRLIIEDAKLGAAGDDISGTLKGDVALRMGAEGGSVAATLGAYTLDLDVIVSKSLQERAGLLLILLDSYKRADAAGTRYAVRLQGANFSSPPKISSR